MNVDKLQVYVNHAPVGEIFREGGNFLFSYLPDCAKEQFVSLTMPVRRQPYVYNELLPIFQMHLPEGYLKSVIQKQFSKIAATDDFGMLRLLANGIRGRVTYNPVDPETNNDLALENLLAGNEGLFEELVDRFALNSAVSGVQPKVLAGLQNRLTFSTDQFIIKAWGADYPELALNEYFCTTIYNLAGLPVAEFFMSNDRRLFITKRFDQHETAYCGFEDMCVLQAKNTRDKYDGSYESVLRTIKNFVSPEYLKESLEQFFKMLVLNNVLQNGDAHLKNFGLTYDSAKSIRLAPVYDVVSTTVYIKNDLSALTLMGSRKWWDKKHLLRFAEEYCEIPAVRAEKLWLECMYGLHEGRELIIAGLKNETNQHALAILTHLETLISQYVDGLA